MLHLTLFNQILVHTCLYDMCHRYELFVTCQVLFRI